jgi:hypothetical protein
MNRARQQSFLLLAAIATLSVMGADAPRSPYAPEPEPGEIPPDAGAYSIKAEVVELPEPKPPLLAAENGGEEKPSAPSAKPKTIAAPSVASRKTDPQPVSTNSPAASAPATAAVATANSAVVKMREPGYGLVLQGTLSESAALGPENSPVLVRGFLVVPEGMTLTLKAGTILHLAADPGAAKPKNASDPDPTQSAVVWVWGNLIAEGRTGNPVDLSNLERTPASLLFYGNGESRLEGTRLRGTGVVQNGGVCHWLNSEFLGAPHVALAAGAALFTHCSLRDCGGIFAAYRAGTWSLMVRRSVFASCREGIVLGSDPGEARLVVESNHFLNTRGAHLRVVNLPGVNTSDRDVLIGENWYGTAEAEDVDLRIADRRQDPRVRARLNIRPPAERPYANTGSGATAEILANTLKLQKKTEQALLQAHAQATGRARLPTAKSEEPRQPLAASHAVKRPRDLSEAKAAKK